MWAVADATERTECRRGEPHGLGVNLTLVSGIVPVVDYLVLDDPPHLVGRQCEQCSAIFVERHNGCGRCGARRFSTIRLADTGVLSSFTIVYRGARDGRPFASGVVELDGGGAVKANLVGVEPDPDRIVLGGRVRLVTFPVATDTEGTQAVAFGFAPLSS